MTVSYETPAVVAGTGEFISMPEVEVESLGTLGFGSGPIKPEGMEAEGSYAELTEAVEECLIYVGLDALGCCMDGRTCGHCLDNSHTETGRVGTAGGDLITGHAAAELTGWYPKDLKQQREKLGYLHENLKSNNVNPGVHCDDLAEKNNFKKADDSDKKRTGCAADDAVQSNLEGVYEHQKELSRIRTSLLGNNIKQTEYQPKDKVIGDHKDWDPTVMIDIVGADAGGHGVEVLVTDNTPTHGHHEIAIYVCDIPGYTLDREAFFKKTGKNIFFINLWRIKQIASAMAIGPNYEDDMNKLVDGGTDFQFSTLGGVCVPEMPMFLIKSKHDLTLAA